LFDLFSQLVKIFDSGFDFDIGCHWAFSEVSQILCNCVAAKEQNYQNDRILIL
jgi:hypothetical protein